MDIFEKMMEGQVRKWMMLVRDQPNAEVPHSVLDYYFRRKAGVAVAEVMCGEDEKTDDDERTE